MTFNPQEPYNDLPLLFPAEKEKVGNEFIFKNIALYNLIKE